MRYSIITSIVILTLAGCTSTAPSESKVAVKYQADLGIKETPWGKIHSYDRLQPSYTEPPVYPFEERRDGITGEVGAAVLVNEQGRVVDVKIIHSSGSSALDLSATYAVKNWRFPTLGERYVTLETIIFAING